MGRFRSILHSFIKPAAMVAAVGAVSLSLIVTTPSNAQALSTRDLKAAETFVMGATKTIAPAANVAMAAATFTPVGLGIRLAQFAFLAYSTSDIWMPFVAGAWGAATGESPSSTPAPGTAVRANISVSGVAKQSLSNLEFTIANSTPPTSTSAATVGYAIRIRCKQSDGVEYNRDVSTTSGIPTNVSSFKIYASCTNTAHEAIGVLIGAFGSHPDLAPACPGAPSGVCLYSGPANVYKWGSTLGISAPAFDPYGADVKHKVRSECIKPDGTKITIEAESSGDYMKFPSCEAAGAGHGTGKTTIVGLAPGTTQEKTLWESPAAPSDPATPLCDASRATTGCVLSVEIDGKPCTAGNVECENWTEINRDPNQSARLKCRFGPYTLPMSSCNALEGAYWVGGSPATEENTDGNPDTRARTTPSGGPIADPAPPAPATGTVPGGGGQPSGDSDAKSKQCFPQGWSMFNPLEWILKPIRCAFEPTTDIAAQGGALRDKAMTKAPLSFVSAIASTAPSSVGGQGACPAWVVSISSTAGGVQGGYSQNVVCESSFIQAIVNARPVLFGLISGAMLWPFLRSLWYAIIPIVRVVPTGGK